MLKPIELIFNGLLFFKYIKEKNKMNRKDFDVAAGIAERMDKLENKIFELQNIMGRKSYTICANNEPIVIESTIVERLGDSPGSILQLVEPNIVDLPSDEIATEVFIQDILQYYIDTLNLELDELRKSFEEI